MALTVGNPYTTLAAFDRQFDDIVGRAWGVRRSRRGDRPDGPDYVPATDISIEGEDVVVTLELPGVDIDENVDIEVTRGRLTISGRRERRAENEEGRTLVRELRHGTFRREFTLPEHVEAGALTATYESGLLRVRVAGANQKAPEATKIPVTNQSPQQ